MNWRVIRHPPILDDEMAYFVALHEIGHCVVGLAGTRLEREAACWRWALDNAICPAHYSTRQRITACLVRYLFRAEANSWAMPEGDSDFWELMRWWEEAPTPWKRNWGRFRQKIRRRSRP